MPSIFSWIKKELVYIKDSFKEIVKGFIIFALASSGLVFAILLRYLGYNGTTITFFSLVIGFISLFLCYLLLKGYLKSKEDQEKSKTKENLP
jgi:ABC-type spermidine/putrescine transport system permease subunit II